MQQSDPNTKTENTDFFSGYGDSCFSRIIWDGCPGVGSYLKGLGGPYFNCTVWATSSRELVYYKKGETTWGDPLEINAASNINAELEVTLYPNPASEFFRIVVPEKAIGAQLVIRNIVGQVVFSKTIAEENSIINIKAMASGTYFYTLISQSINAASGKLLIN